MTPLARITVAVAAALTTTLTAAPAAASASEPLWHRIACSSGTVEHVVTTEQGQDFLTLTGQLDCATHDDNATFGFARFDTGWESGVLLDSNLHSYQTVAPSPYSKGRPVDRNPLDFAICVVTDHDVFIGCVQLERAAGGSELRVASLAPDHPTYGRPFRLVRGGPIPACGTCW